MLMDLKGDFGLAYVRAVAHAAEYFVQEAGRGLDGDGVDLTLFRRGPGGLVRSPRLDLQVKTTSTTLGELSFAYDLKVKNYEELRSTQLQVPRILVVVVVPEQVQEWLVATEEQLVLRRCGYWRSLRGAAPTTNTSTIRVEIPRNATFTVAQVQQLMNGIANGRLP